jgi:formamidopyrimidine-DNA glycosylase
LPEGPEIRRTADRIAAVLVGERLNEVWFGLPRLVRFSDELAGARVESVESRSKAQGISRRRYRFAVFGRANEPCPICGSKIERMQAGARRLYSCPRCQQRHAE